MTSYNLHIWLLFYYDFFLVQQYIGLEIWISDLLFKGKCFMLVEFILTFILVLYYFIIPIEESNGSHWIGGLGYSILSFDKVISICEKK